MLPKASSRLLRYILKSSSRHVLKTFCKRFQHNNFLLLPGCLQKIFKMSWGQLPDFLKMPLQDIFKKSWKMKNCNPGDVLEVNKCLLGLFNNVWINYNFVLDSFNLRFDRFLKFIVTTWFQKIDKMILEYFSE